MFSFFRKKVKETNEQVATKDEVVEDFSDVTKIASYFKSLSGVTFEKQLTILESKTKSFCRHHHIYSYDALIARIESDASLRQELTNTLTTNETFFYREFTQIEELVTSVKEHKTHARILCAPCATGEESYSIAIALLEAGVTASSFEIVGIDINSVAIEKAYQGIYRERNVKNLSQELKERYFTQEDDKFKLNERIKSLVEFKVANIFEPSFKELGKFDYIFSRNMLIYFDYATKIKAKKILESMRNDETQEIFFGHADLF
jgi:chemotaxis protein methyltransferase CheR